MGKGRKRLKQDIAPEAETRGREEKPEAETCEPEARKSEAREPEVKPRGKRKNTGGKSGGSSLRKKDRERKSRVRIWLDLLLMVCLVCELGVQVFQSRHWQVVAETSSFTETAEYLPNEDRGFYYIHGFHINDEENDFVSSLRQRFMNDKETTLAMIQINLQSYNDGPISEEGLANLEDLFCAMEETGKHYLVRFLYDWHGENEEWEPENIHIILQHMRQVEDIVRRHRSEIFVIQGLFIGNWGEMNGTRYLSVEDLRSLAKQLQEVTDSGNYLAVRMPAQWRKIVDTGNPDLSELPKDSLARRLGLFNDGMLGNEGDYGTYGSLSAEEAGYSTLWRREDELEFQEELCKWVPNGGEVISDNPVNDFEAALADLKKMHVTYLNRDYDRNVLDKWERTTIREAGCYNGMDGLNYIERHLGYRFTIRRARMSYDFGEDRLLVGVSLQNVGFAPVYREKTIQVILCSEDGETMVARKMDFDLRTLTGGTKADETAEMVSKIYLSRLPEGKYKVYFRIEDTETGEPLLLAVEQERTRLGYCIGGIEIKW